MIDDGLEFLALGAIVHRLDPGWVPFRKATSCEIHVSGGEFNVAANLSDCFDVRAGIATAMVDYPIGELVARSVRSAGVTAFYRRFEHDGVRGPNIATVYSDRGYGPRPPVVFYNRANEAAAQLAPGDFDWGAIFSRGVRWFHSGGIFAALSSTTGDLIVEAMEAAKAAGATVSFDLNYRKKLWDVWGGRDSAVQVMRRIVGHVDVLVGNEEDLQQALGIPGPDVERESSFDAASFIGMIERLHAEHPNVKVVATTLREVHSSSRHSWGAVAWGEGDVHVSPTHNLDVFDRVGGGDGFASGFFYGLLSGEPLETAVRWGAAHGALLATFKGDTTMATFEEVRRLAAGASARIQR